MLYIKSSDSSVSCKSYSNGNVQEAKNCSKTTSSSATEARETTVCTPHVNSQATGVCDTSN